MAKNKAVYLQVGTTKEQKEVFDLIARRSPQGSTSALLLSLIEAEIHRVVKFDKEVQALMLKQATEELERETGGSIIGGDVEFVMAEDAARG